MRNLVAAVAIALVAALGFAGPAAAVAVQTSTAKVVIVVGATHSATATYRSYADQAYAEAIKYTPNVTKVYSPNATWAKVKAAAYNANILIYFGHGNGWPSPYTYDPTYSTKDGMGLNYDANGDGKLTDYEMKYYGEPSMAQLHLAPNAIVLLHNLCYASGNSEPGNAEPTVSVAHQRIDNYAAGFLKGGARAVVADGHMGPQPYLAGLFTTGQSILGLWRSMPNFNGHESSFASSRSPGYTAYSDPETTSSRFYRSLVTAPTITTTAVTNFIGDTGADPASLVVPGRASVGTSPVPLMPSATGSDLAAELTLPAGTRLKTVALAAPATAESPAIIQVEGLDDASIKGFVSAADLAPRDSRAPVLLGIEAGEGWFSPNGDGSSDTQAVGGQFSETVSWTFEVKNGGGAVVASSSGTGDTFDTTWDGKADGAAVADGIYTWAVRGVDAWRNGTATGGGTFVVDNLSAVASTYTPIAPYRVLDSRDGTGLAGVFTAGTPRTFPVAGAGTVPADAVAVTGNVTLVGQTAAGFLAVTPTATASPTSSTLNVPRGDIRANNFTLPLGPGGSLAAVFKAVAGSSTHVVVDITGYFTAGDGGATYQPLTSPVRVLDSRPGGTGLGGAFTARVGRTLQVAGVGGIPAGAKAITANLTVVNQTAAGYLAVTPTLPAGLPASSTLNFPRGDIRANGLTAALGTGGSLAITYVAVAGARADVVLDVTGYYLADGSGLRFHALAPGRLLDSRATVLTGLAGPFKANVARILPAAGRWGVPARGQGDHRQPDRRRPDRGRLRGGHPGRHQQPADLDPQRAARRHPGERHHRAPWAAAARRASSTRPSAAGPPTSSSTSPATSSRAGRAAGRAGPPAPALDTLAHDGRRPRGCLPRRRAGTPWRRRLGRPADLQRGRQPAGDRRRDPRRPAGSDAPRGRRRIARRHGPPRR